MNSAVNILHIISSAEISGGERYLYDLIRYSTKQFKHLIALPYHGPFENILEKEGYKYSIIDLQKKFSIKSLCKLIKIVNKKNVNILHTHGYRANFYGRIVCIFTNAKNVSTVHVSLYDYIDTPIPIKYFYIFLEKFLSYKTKKFLCISKAMQDDAIKLGIKKSKLVLIPNGVDIERFKLQKCERKKQEIGLNTFSPIIGTVGRMVPEKGQVYLIEALKKLKSDWHNIKCLFVGDGPMLKDLKQQAIVLGIQDCCIFAGTVTDIETIFPILDVFILPSLREPFGLVLLEAMACGIPTIATNTGGPNDFISDGINGFLVPAMDADALSHKINFLLENKEISKSIGIKGWETVTKCYDIKDTVDKIEKVYLEIINNHHSNLN